MWVKIYINNVNKKILTMLIKNVYENGKNCRKVVKSLKRVEKVGKSYT